ncbi:MAG: hypothetical protein MK135_10745, partial [Polyangiaceae bacterium]|nr:hypothetical protein [Polyangiaceae bacterium]
MRKPCRSLGFGLALFSLIFCQAQSLFAQVKGAPLPAPPPAQPAPSQPAPAVAPAPARSLPKEGDSTSKAGTAQDEMAPEDSSEKKAELGVYFELFGIALFSPTGSTNPWAGGESCPSLGVDGLTLAVPCDARAPIGAA